MLNPAEQDKVRTIIRTDWFIYLSFVVAVVMYVFVIILVTRSSSSEATQAGALKRLFIVVSVVLGVAKFWIRSRLMFENESYRKCRTLDEIIRKYERYNQYVFAMCETPAVLGVIIALMTRRVEEWWVFFAISAVLFVTSAPRRDKFQSIVEAHAARGFSTESSVPGTQY